MKGKSFIWTDEHEKKFQSAKGSVASISALAERVGIPRRTLYSDSNKDLREKFAQAVQSFEDDLLAESLAVLRRNLSDEDPKIAQNAAKILLDRSYRQQLRADDKERREEEEKRKNSLDLSSLEFVWKDSQEEEED